MAKGVTRFFGDPAPIQSNYLVADFLKDIGDLPVVKSVHIQVGAADEDEHLAEARWLQAMHVQYGFPHAMVAFCDLASPNREQWLDQLQAFSCLKGVRQIIGRSPDEDQQTGTGELINSKAFKQGLASLERRGLSFDLQLIPDQMQTMAAVLEQFSELKVVICHAGSPWYRDEQGYLMWQAGIDALAKRPNTYCKLSGLGMFDHSWTTSSIAPIAKKVIEAFGSERVMIGSNFPVDKLYSSYGDIIGAYRTLIEPYNAQQQNQMLHDTAATFYKLNA